MALRDFDTAVWLLWLYQFAFALLPGIALLAATIGVFLVYEFAEGVLARRQRQPFDPGLRGVPDIALSHILAALFLWGVRTALSIAVAFVGLVVILLIDRMRDPVQETARRLEDRPLFTGTFEPQLSTDFVILLSLFGTGVSLISVVSLYVSLRRLARDWRARSATAGADRPEPLIVRLFGEVRFAGLAVMFVLLYPVLGIVMQMVWAVVLLVPLPVTMTQISVPGGFTMIVWVLATMWLMMIAVLSSPIVGILKRWILMTLAHYRANLVFQILLKVLFAFWVGVLGLAIAMLVQLETGEWLYPSHFSRWTPAQY
ncbi:hypothetical protein [Ostreiculturibacter nitratireducens]|uniref:hypothetical protein n=1 Tax=Ostreiculturibacter nitratireducens TaxID=3075226 RepID=UPI0031B58363